MFERFTARARQVIVLAQDEARALKHNYIGTEHILLGLLREEEGLAAQTLSVLDVTLDEARSAVAREVGPGDELRTGQIPFAPRAKKVLELALREALSLDHNYIGTEHLLLALVRETGGAGARVLLEFGVTPDDIRAELGPRLSKPMSGNPIRPSPGTSLGSSHFPDRPAPPPWWQRAEVDLRWLFVNLGLALGLGILVGWAIWGH